MSTTQQQKDLFKQRKKEYDNAATAAEKTALVEKFNEENRKGTNTAVTVPENKNTAAEESKNNPFEDLASATATASKAAEDYYNFTKRESLVDDDTYRTLEASFRMPSTVLAADSYLTNALKQIQKGKTSYTDSIRDLTNEIMNRDKFSYDVDSDPLFQQALASAMVSGKQAMGDTMGQAAALTGGYGSSYATSAANQAYNEMLETAYDNLPQYYQLARDTYQAEGDELYRQLGMLNEADLNEYQRLLSSYDATAQQRDRSFSEAYNLFRDTKSDAMTLADLSFSEYGQLANDAYNRYNLSRDVADTLYARNYQEWQDVYAREQDALNREWAQSQYYDSRYWENYWNQQDLDYKKNAAYQDQKNWEKEYAQQLNAYKISTGDMDANGILSKVEMEKQNKLNGNADNTKVRADFKFDSNEKANIRNVYTNAYNLYSADIKTADKAEELAAEAVAAYLTEQGLPNMTEAEENIIAQIVGSAEQYYMLDGVYYTANELRAALQKKYPAITQEAANIMLAGLMSNPV